MAGTRDEYEDATRQLRQLALDLLEAGNDEESVARSLVARRNALKVEFRQDLPRVVLARIEQRNIAKYGDPVGPSPDWLFRKYANWALVIEAASRPANLRIGL